MYYRVSQYGAVALSALGWLLVGVAAAQFLYTLITGGNPMLRALPGNPVQTLVVTFLQTAAIGLAVAVFGAVAHAILEREGRQ